VTAATGKTYGDVATAAGLGATEPLPLLIDEGGEGRMAIYGHVAKANPQWLMAAIAKRS